MTVRVHHNGTHTDFTNANVWNISHGHLHLSFKDDDSLNPARPLKVVATFNTWDFVQLVETINVSNIADDIITRTTAFVNDHLLPPKRWAE